MPDHRVLVMATVAALSLVGASVATAGIIIPTVSVGNPGNAADTTGFGSVAYSYNIGQTEVTNAQYAAFLNCVAATDTHGLYNTNMAGSFGGITRLNGPGNYAYATVTGREDNPVNFVSFWDATRFANWLHNGKPTGAQSNATTENGAYTLHGVTNPVNVSVTRNTGWQWAVTNEDEWYKSAYHQPASAGGDADNYWLYPTSSNSMPTTAQANFGSAIGDTTPVGSYAANFYGTFDMGGNVCEWNETITDVPPPFPLSLRGQRGGSFINIFDYGQRADESSFDDPSNESDLVGFRVSQVPGPSSVALLGLGGIFAARRRRRTRPDRTARCAAVRAREWIAATAVVGSAAASTAHAHWNPNYLIQRIGLLGPDHTGSEGLQSSTASLFDTEGRVVGYSTRYTGATTYNGQDAWIWNGATTTQIGLIGDEYTGTSGYRWSGALAQSPAGHVLGLSRRILGQDTSNGSAVWTWNSSGVTRLGFDGPEYTGTTGYQMSEAGLLNESGQVAGTSDRISGADTVTARDAWVWNGASTIQVGLLGGTYEGSAGLRSSFPLLQSTVGQVAGNSIRYTGVNTIIGRDAWAWNGTSTVQIGLTSDEHAGPVSGTRYSVPTLQNRTGQISGFSRRYGPFLGESQNGVDAWISDGSTTTQVGLIGSGYESSSGYRFSSASFQNDSGQVAGYSYQVDAVGTQIGQDVWVWNGSSTLKINPAIGRSAFARPAFQNAAGQIVGITGASGGPGGAGPNSSANSINPWVWNGGVAVEIGLTDEAHRSNHPGNLGVTTNWPTHQSTSGQVAGYALRMREGSPILGANGRDTWVWNGATTMQIGLSGGVYTGSAGFQFGVAESQNAAGQVAGISNRIVGVNTTNGQDAWYFDPVTSLTSAVIGSVRSSDGYAFSTPTILTEDGFLLGNYTFFDGGLGSGEQRAFIFRPDLGLTDLGSLVNGGLTINGWSTLQNPIFSDALTTIVGYGYINGQTSGQSVFVMTIPAPGAAAVLGLSGLITMRRRRR